jgi:hypothetical protein
VSAQGRCLLPADESGRILDRLAGLEQVIAPELVRQSLLDASRVNRRSCKLTHEVTLWVVLAMGLLTDLPIRQVFKHSRRLRVQIGEDGSAMAEDTPERSSLCVARQRLGVAPLRALFARVVRPLATFETRGAFYRGFRLVGIDGSVYNLPDSPANAKAFGRPSGGDRGEGAFPQIRKLSLVELGTRVEIAFLLKRLACGELTMVSGLLRYLTSEMLLLLDRGFFSYEMWKTLDPRVRLLARVKNNLILKPVQHLADGSYLAKIYPSPRAREKDREGILVRVIRYRLDEPARVGHDEEHVLITNLLSAEEYPALELIPLYHERWEHELLYDEQKTHQDPRRATKPANLRSETPAGVIQEMYALSLGHFVVRSLMFAAADAADLDPDRLSFTGCLHILRCRLPECDSRTAASYQAWYAALLWEMQQERVEPRRHRINPRVVKQKLSKWPKKRPEHRGLHPPTKTFMQSVVLTI